MSVSQQAMDLLQIMKGGSYSLSRDVIKHRVWDTRYFTATHDDNTFFTQQIGAAWRFGTQKTLNETNMYDSGKLPAGQIFLGCRMSVCFISYMIQTATNADRLAQGAINILQSSVFEIKLQGREWDYQIHGSEFLPRPIAITGTAAAANVARVGDMIASGWSNLMPTPIALDQLVSFSVIQRLGNPDANVDLSLDAACALFASTYSTMQVTIEGLLTRSK